MIRDKQATTQEDETITDEAAKRDYLATEIHCERCGVHVDGNICYQQAEHTTLSGRRIAVTAYYCDGCKALLQAIGGGEHSAMQARAGESESYEAAYKDDIAELLA